MEAHVLSDSAQGIASFWTCQWPFFVQSRLSISPKRVYPVRYSMIGLVRQSSVLQDPKTHGSSLPLYFRLIECGVAPEAPGLAYGRRAATVPVLSRHGFLCVSGNRPRPCFGPAPPRYRESVCQKPWERMGVWSRLAGSDALPKLIYSFKMIGTDCGRHTIH